MGKNIPNFILSELSPLWHTHLWKICLLEPRISNYGKSNCIYEDVCLCLPASHWQGDIDVQGRYPSILGIKSGKKTFYVKSFTEMFTNISISIINWLLVAPCEE